MMSSNNEYSFKVCCGAGDEIMMNIESSENVVPVTYHYPNIPRRYFFTNSHKNNKQHIQRLLKIYQGMDSIRDKLLSVDSTTADSSLRRLSIPSLEQRNSQLSLLENITQNQQQDAHNEMLQSSSFGADFQKSALRRRKNSIVNIVSSSKVDDEDDSNVYNESYIIIEFERDVNKNTLHWIVDKIRGKRTDDGAELIIHKEPSTKNSEGLILHITATKIKLLELADEMAFMKKTKTGIMRSFNVACLDDFILDDNMSIDDILSSADCQILVKYALDNIKAQENEKYMPGCVSVPLYHGESIIHATIKANIIKNIYTLHDKDYLKKLGSTWYKSYQKQPIQAIRNYFGESIGMYFSFIGFYTIALVAPTILGIIQFFFPTESVPFFCVFYIVWMKVFLEMWKRKSTELAYNWGTVSMTNLDTPRIGYYGKIQKDAITGKMTPQYPKWKTTVQMYLVTVPIIIITIFLACTITISQFWIEDALVAEYGRDSYMTYIPSICNSVYVAILAIQYEKFATWLTELENHRTQKNYEMHRVNKLIVLEFVNNFLSLFYVAFVKQDLKLLQSQLMTQLIILQFIQNFQETLLPKLRQYMGQFMGSVLEKVKYEKLTDSETLETRYDDLNLKDLDDDDLKVKQRRNEGLMDEYNTYDDYLELYIQFGYVVLFAAVAPLAAFWAFLNNVFEIRLDAFRLCRVYRRPFAKRVKNTGSWQLAFEALAVIAIITNCGILYISPQIRSLKEDWTSEIWLLVFIGVEHLLLLFTWYLHKAIPDSPHWVRVALAKADYQSRQALKRENTQKTRHLLFRRFKSVHQSPNNYASYNF